VFDNLSGKNTGPIQAILTPGNSQNASMVPKLDDGYLNINCMKI